MTSPRDESPTVTNSLPLSHIPNKRRVLAVFGTRPEAIKLCPLISVLRREPYRQEIQTLVCVTAQHREMLDQILSAFGVQPDYDLNAMQAGQSLPALTARLLTGLEEVLLQARPALTVVQGDTTTTLSGALASFYGRVPVAHVEAGLRTGDMNSPFPEEMNRVLTARVAKLHFSATPWAAENLLREGVAPQGITVTGNTGIDAVLQVRDDLASGKLNRYSLASLALPLDKRKKLIIVTAHRRENFGSALVQICEAVSTLARRPDVQVVWPVHRNPNVQATVKSAFERSSNVILTEPLDYFPFVDLMRQAYMVLTDSGGIQEEGPSLGKPILVLRENTERPEAVAAGTVKLTGTRREVIVREAERLLDDREEYDRMARLHNPYGDGKASERIATMIASFLKDSHDLSTHERSSLP